MTLSNRITLAGAIPLLVAVAVAVLVAAIALAPTRPASADASADNCKLSPMFLDMLLDRYSLKSFQCNTLNLEPTAISAFTLAEGEDADAWDFSGQELDSFAISDDDAKILRAITDTDLTDTTDDGTVVEAGVRYIDLTDNPLTVDDVSFKNIPSNVAVILSAESNVSGFQATDYEVTEGVAGYISVAFPNIHDDDATADVAATAADESDMTVTVTLSGDATVTENPALGTDEKDGLVSLGVGEELTRTFVANSGAEDVIFYWPITVAKDNENDDEWDITLAIAEGTGITNAETGFELFNDEADVAILDADAPAVSVCDRSEDVQEEILAYAADTTRGGGSAGTGETSFGGNVRCDDITTRDLGTVMTLEIDDFDGDNEPLEDLVAGDFDNLAGLTTLTVTGARSLPSGIFAGVGSAGDDKVVISFAKNTSTDDDVDNVGDFKPSTIPAHIWDDQEAQQVIVLADDLDDDDKPVTSGLDAGLYAGEEGGHFFVLTKTSTAAYVLGSQVDFAAAALAADGANPIGMAAISQTFADDTTKVVRFAIDIPQDDNDKDEMLWLFLFPSDDDVSSAGTNTNVENATDLEALATVAVTDDD